MLSNYYAPRIELRAVPNVHDKYIAVLVSGDYVVGEYGPVWRNADGDLWKCWGCDWNFFYTASDALEFVVKYSTREAPGSFGKYEGLDA